MVAAYLITRENQSLEQALAHVRRQRPVANPNHGFLKQLESLETRISSLSLTSIIISPDLSKRDISQTKSDDSP
jgi:hypothetical protein